MSLNTQAKVLRALQEQQFTRVGGTKLLRSMFECWLLEQRSHERDRERCLSGRSLLSSERRPIVVPPLRERHQDIPLLIRHFMKLHAEEQGLRMKEVTPEAMNVFQQYEWPGNIRELRNLIER
jgi:two-component system nitrogen regulation response regulator NtrX